MVLIIITKSLFCCPVSLHESNERENSKLKYFMYLCIVINTEKS